MLLALQNFKEWVGVGLIVILIIIFSRSVRKYEEGLYNDEEVLPDATYRHFWGQWPWTRG